MMLEGRVKVNGKVVRELGTKVDPESDDIRVDGMPVLTDIKPKPIYILLNKPLGYVSTVHDPHAEMTIMDLIGQVKERVYPVGRLDADSSGLLLLTNDGEFANRLTHPRYHVPKIYRARVRGFVERDKAQQLTEGIDLKDGKTAPAKLKFVTYDTASQCSIIDITLYEGRNRQVRRMFEAIGHPVKALERIGFGNITLGHLNPGTWRKLNAKEVDDLIALAKPLPVPKKENRRPKSDFYTSRDSKPVERTVEKAAPFSHLTPRPRRDKQK